MVISTIVGCLLLLLVWYSTKQNRVKAPVTLTQQYVSFVTRFNFLSIKKYSSTRISIYNSNYTTIDIETKKSKIHITIEGVMPGNLQHVLLKVELPANSTAQQLIDKINQATDPYMETYRSLSKSDINFVELLEKESQIQTVIDLTNYIYSECTEIPDYMQYECGENLRQLAEKTKSIVDDYTDLKDFILNYKTPLNTLIPIQSISETWTLYDFLVYFFNKIETIKTDREALSSIVAEINQSDFVKTYKEDVLNT